MIGFPEEDRMAAKKNESVVDGLKRVLADSYTLYIKTHGHHWNVTGPNFPALHAMFEEQYTELAGAVDTIAERIRALHAAAPGHAAHRPHRQGVVARASRTCGGGASG